MDESKKISDALIKRLNKRFNAQAVTQLRKEINKLASENEQLKRDLAYAQDSADFWQDHSTNMHDALDDEDFCTHRSIGLTKDGQLLVIKNDTEH